MTVVNDSCQLIRPTGLLLTYTIYNNEVVLLIDDPIHELAKLVTHAMIWGYIGDECPPPPYSVFFTVLLQLNPTIYHGYVGVVTRAIYYMKPILKHNRTCTSMQRVMTQKPLLES